jgi:hypothetical protein
MAVPGAQQGRSTREWIIRAIIAGGIAAIGFWTMSHTIADMLRTRNLRQAHAIAPDDARILAQLSNEELLHDPSVRGRVVARRLAQAALLRDPAAVTAVATLGIEAQLRGNTQLARRIFTYSELLSRRNLATQLWAIEDAVGRRDISGALRHYDIALRTSRESSKLLFPVLSSAISDAKVRNSLISTLADKPSWSIGFIYHLAASGNDPRAAALLFDGMRRKGIQVPEAAHTALINTLIANGFVENAWMFYVTTHPGSNRRRTRDPYFSANVATPSPFDWIPADEGSISASIQRSTEGGAVFDFAAPASVGGTVLQQLQLLSPGQYRLQGRSIGIEQASESQPYWTLTCRDGRELGQISIQNSSQSAGLFEGVFSVPSDCSVQTLSLIVRPSDMQSGVTGQITQLLLEPVSRP